jgi:tetratricopeptide (TPR) repeat protein
MTQVTSRLFSSVRPAAVFVALGVALACTLSAPAHADDYTDVGQLIRSGKLDEAQAKADAYLVGKPRDPQMRFLKGVIQTEAGKTDDAIATLNALTQEYPELPEPYNNLAALYAGQNQYDKARTALEMAIRINPGYATAHENLGDVYAKLASQSYSKALQLDANNKLAGQKVVLLKEVLTPPAKPTKGAAKPAAAVK